MTMSSKAPLPPTGTRDFLPSAVRRRRAVMEVILKHFERHGFEPLETPAMERLDVLLGKYGEEGDKLLFRVLHRGDKLKRQLEKPGIGEADLAELGLRYDLTVPLARVVANHGDQLTRIFKRYQIQPVWRADRPAKGRFREFFQCDVDIVGSGEILAELDIFSAVCEIMDELGISGYELHVNHRRWLSGLLESLEIPGGRHAMVLGALDKLDKIGPEGVLRELEKPELEPGAVARLAELFPAFMEEDPQPGNHAFRVREMTGGPNAMEQLQVVLDQVTGRLGRLKWNPLLARGLDYYTGLIYELRIPPWSSSFGGGGRYDNLIGMFSGRSIPAVGFSFGLERLMEFIEEHGPTEAQPCHADAVVAVLDSSALKTVSGWVASLREQGFRMDLFPEITSPGKVMKWADRKKVKWVFLAGLNELETGTVFWKNLASGESGSLAVSEIPLILG